MRLFCTCIVLCALISTTASLAAVSEKPDAPPAVPGDAEEPGEKQVLGEEEPDCE